MELRLWGLRSARSPSAFQPYWPDQVGAVQWATTHTMIKAIAISLIFIATWPSYAQPDRGDGGLEVVISRLRACIRSHAEAAWLAGVRSEGAAAEFFLERCNATVLRGLAEAKDAVVPPGRFRFVAYEEWRAFSAGLNNR